ncbi:MAG: hypothetical protein PHD04_00890 [Candidatus Pacebacteria bacterium]|nr:hypothetical protein [Candidatus Paceibacterota bacterium]
MKELTAKYRITFGNPIGMEVLADFLDTTHFGVTLNPDNPVQIAEYNVGVATMAKLGIFSSGTKEAVIRALMAIVPSEAAE